LKDLQAKTVELEEVTSKMTEENSRLKARLQALEMENSALKGQNVTFSFPVCTPPASLDPTIRLAIGRLMVVRKLQSSPRHIPHLYLIAEVSPIPGA